MKNTIVYVGMDVHKESFTLADYTIDSEKSSNVRRTPADYKEILKYLEHLRTIYGSDANFICGYEAGCLGYSLYHQLTDRNVNCVILAPTTVGSNLAEGPDEHVVSGPYPYRYIAM